MSYALSVCGVALVLLSNHVRNAAFMNAATFGGMVLCVAASLLRLPGEFCPTLIRSRADQRQRSCGTGI